MTPAWWDALGHLSAIGGGGPASFVYDAFGRRMAKTIKGTAPQLLYDGLNPAQELNGASPPAVAANLLTGLGIDEYFTRTDSSGTMALLSDALGSTVGLVNSGGRRGAAGTPPIRPDRIGRVFALKLKTGESLCSED